MTYEEMLAKRDKYFDELEALNKKLTRIIKKIDKHLANTYDDVFYSNLRKNDFPKYLETILMSHVDGREIENNYYELQKFILIIPGRFLQVYSFSLFQTLRIRILKFLQIALTVCG